MLHGIEVSRAAAILKNIETYESAHYPQQAIYNNYDYIFSYLLHK